MTKKGIIGLWVVVLLIGSCSTAAARKYTGKKYRDRGYQKEFHMGYGAGVGQYSMSRYEVETVQGLRLNPYLFVGAGVGFHYYSKPIKGGDYDSESVDMKVIPVFLNFKGYLLRRPVKPFVSVDAGYGMSVRQEVNFNGFYVSPSAGVLFDVPRFGGIALSVGYQSQRLDGRWRYPSEEKTSINLGAVSFKFGIVF